MILGRAGRGAAGQREEQRRVRMHDGLASAGAAHRHALVDQHLLGVAEGAGGEADRVARARRHGEAAVDRAVGRRLGAVAGGVVARGAGPDLALRGQQRGEK